MNRIVDPWASSLDECLGQIDCTVEGLTSTEAQTRLRVVDPNQFETETRRHVLLQLLFRFRNPRPVVVMRERQRESVKTLVVRLRPALGARAANDFAAIPVVTLSTERDQSIPIPADCRRRTTDSTKSQLSLRHMRCAGSVWWVLFVSPTLLQ
jgi:hypothetical protein